MISDELHEEGGASSVFELDLADPNILSLTSESFVVKLPEDEEVL